MQRWLSIVARDNLHGIEEAGLAVSASAVHRDNDALRHDAAEREADEHLKTVDQLWCRLSMPHNMKRSKCLHWALGS